MTPELIAAMVDYGGYGVLILLFIGISKVGLKAADTIVGRSIASFDRLDMTLEKLQSKLSDSETAAERRHAETRLFIAETGKETRHHMSGQLQIVCGSIEAALARELGHHIRRKPAEEGQ